MKKEAVKIAVLLLLTTCTFNSCKKNRTCICTLTYFNGTTQTREVDVGKTTVKGGQDKCNDATKDIVTQETPNGLSSAKCEIK